MATVTTFLLHLPSHSLLLSPQTPSTTYLIFVLGFLFTEEIKLQNRTLQTHYHIHSLSGICAHILCVPAVHIDEQTMIDLACCVSSASSVLGALATWLTFWGFDSLICKMGILISAVLL